MYCIGLNERGPVEKSEAGGSLRTEFRWLGNPATLVWYLTTMIFGMMFGAYDTFFFDFAQA